MVQAIRMPMMGNTMESGLLAEWRVDEGDAIEEDNVVAVVESEKAAADVVANQDGTLARVDVVEGEEVPPGTLLGVVVGEDESLNEAPPPRSRIAPIEEDDAVSTGPEPEEATAVIEEADSESPPEESSDEIRAAPGARKLASEHDVDLAEIMGTGPENAVLRADIEEWIHNADHEPETEPAVQTADNVRAFASPSTRRLARELGVSIDEVDGSGIGDRITESDVRAAAGQIDQSQVGHDRIAEAANGTQRDQCDASTLGVTIEEERELSQMRRTIADRMSRSARQAPHVTNKREVPVERALEAADDLAAEFDAPIGLTDVLIAAVTRALETHPEFNAWYEGDRLRLVAERNVAVAVDTDAGLVTPVIRETGTRSLDGIADERRRLTDSVLQGSYTMYDLQGGTFTITNLGMFGVDSFDPIINPPQVAILGVGRIREDADERTCVLSLSFDHRAVDGVDAARFLDTVADGLESPAVLATDRASIGRGGRESVSSPPDDTDRDDGEPIEKIEPVIARDLTKQAEEIAAAHGWPIPEFEVRLKDDRPVITVEAPDGTSTAAMKRLSYAACRDSTYAGTISRLYDPEITIA